MTTPIPNCPQPEPKYSDAEDRLGAWMAAALDDPKVCAEMKADINRWFAFMDSRPSTPDKAGVSDADALAHFTEYFVRNYPGPDTIISNPKWHAPKIFRAAQYAITHFAPQSAERVVEGWVGEIERCDAKGFWLVSADNCPFVPGQKVSITAAQQADR